MYLNWIDYIIIVLLLYHAYLGWTAGAFYLLSNFLSFFGSLALAVFLYQPAGIFLADKFGIPEAWKLVIGYVLVGLLAHFILSEIFHMFFSKLPKNLLHSKISNWLGMIISAVNGFLLVAFFLLVIIILPVRGTIKKDIRSSQIASRIVTIAEKYSGPVTSVVEEARSQANKFFTIAPKSKESIILDVTPKASDLRVDAALETQMIGLVNKERVKVGLAALVADSSITNVARAYSRDMFLRKYFSHYSPEGQNVADRFAAVGISYSAVGENLAYAPDVETAHEGLMNSPEHKANILESRFHRLGIGIIVTDSFGMMITQNFAD